MDSLVFSVLQRIGKSLYAKKLNEHFIDGEQDYIMERSELMSDF